MRFDVAANRDLEECLAPLLAKARRRDVLEMAACFPDGAANIAEMAIVKKGSFAPHCAAAPERARVLVWNVERVHGNAILSRWPLRDVRRIPMPVEFGLVPPLRASHRHACGFARHHRWSWCAAHGGRCPSRGLRHPMQRARQMRVLLQSLDDAPRAIVGGDFNTLGVLPGWRGGIRLLRERAHDVHRLTPSVALHEPLFEEARRAGFSWRDLNAPSATWRVSRLLPSSLGAKLDWVFGREVSVEPGSAAVVSAQIGSRSRRLSRLSDHDGLSLRVRLS
jgi:endonuclease/exonuclease/phosphatase family metal-dependent hydrolase